MAIRDKDKIDGISEIPGNGPIRLLMIEDREWTFSSTQLEEFENKISAYYNFVATGQLTRALPGSNDRKCIVELRCQHEPPEKFMQMFHQVTALYAKRAIEFKVVLVRSLGGATAELQLYP